MLAVAALTLAVGLGGCTTTADCAYNECQFGPGYQSERAYESRLYGGTEQGFGGESCRVEVRREVGAFGEVSSREVTVCDAL